VGVGSERIHVISHSHTVCNDKWSNTEILNDAETNIHRKWVLKVGFYDILLIGRHTVNAAAGIIFINTIED
jgi:hypothetical protein